ncbi:MAG: rRNA maturation RNase YbeY [Legionellales bacterium]|nr:rRNA maturation RNase YbeY [Legionellales bacterium]
MSIIIELQNESHALELPTLSQLQLWVDRAYLSRCEKGEVCIRLVDTQEIAALNFHYRHKNKPTNVLSFPADIPHNLPFDTPLLGDLILCPAVIEHEAKMQGKPLIAHWCHIVIHGCLHLIGYDHIKKADAVIMEGIEIDCLKELGFPNPYGEISSL